MPPKLRYKVGVRYNRSINAEFPCTWLEQVKEATILIYNSFARKKLGSEPSFLFYFFASGQSRWNSREQVEAFYQVSHSYMLCLDKGNFLLLSFQNFVKIIILSVLS